MRATTSTRYDLSCLLSCSCHLLCFCLPRTRAHAHFVRPQNGDPIGNGFVDTCDEDGSKCHFDDNSFCIGKGRSWNCATCVGTDAKPEEPKVLVSFYGTDSDGKHLLSGSSNPLNFRRFALGNVYTDLRDDVVSEYKSISKDVEKQWNDIV